MTTIDEWANRHHISTAALIELKCMMGIDDHIAAPHGQPNDHPMGSEARQQDLISLEAARMKIRLFRNNSGAFTTDEGRVVRFGLGNVSKQWNETFASPDLVGWRKRLITESMVGTVIGQVCMREVKHEGWRFNPNSAHENAQWNFIKLAVADGCDAAFATGPGSL